MRDLYQRVTSLASLRNAWEEIEADASAAERESIAPSIQRFRKHADEKLEKLSQALASGEYLPKNLTRIEFPKSDGGIRVIDVPAVRDRVVERSLLKVLAPLVDPFLGHASFAYREGLGVRDAVQEVARLRDEGLGWVLRADVDDCFPSLPKDLAVDELREIVRDRSLDELVNQLLGRRTSTPHGLREVPGIPQGTSLSPLLANLVLRHLDAALLDAGFPVVRYADDFTVVAKTAFAANAARKVADQALKELGMTLGEDKTELMSFEQGFAFLGEDFGSRYPLVENGHRVEEPVRKTVFLGSRGSRAWMSEGRLEVKSKNDASLLDVPISHVERIVCFGPVGVSAGLRSWAFYHDVDIVFCSKRGNYLGQHLSATSPKRPARLRAQLDATGSTEVAMPVAIAIVSSKMRHQLTLLRRYTRQENADELRECVTAVDALLVLLRDAANPSEIMGIEGAAAVAYFEGLAAVLPAELEFDGRSRRPPLDIMNAALGYGYAILLGEAVAALVAAGLDPSIGFLHSDSDNRPSLALDLMEEFRPYVVDLAIVQAARRGTLTVEHGRTKEGREGVWLTKAGKSVVVESYERRMLQVTGGALPEFRGSIRRHLYRQAQRLASAVTGAGDPWTGLSWR